MQIFAKICSITLHPLFMGIYGVSLLFIYTDFKFIFAGQFFHFLFPVFVLSCLIPLNGLFFLKRIHLIKDYDLKDKNERLFPFIITFFSYALLFYYFLRSGLYIWFLGLLAAPLLLLMIASVISFYWKISAHMMGIGGLIGGVLSVSYNVKQINPYVLFIILFILAGCLGTSRLILKRHTPIQVYIGFVVGLIVSYLCIWVSVNWSNILFIYK